MLSPLNEIERSLDILELPTLIKKEDIKKQYHFLAKKNHPDAGGDAEEMEQLNHAYKLLMKYIEGFRYSFDEEEVAKQFPGADYVNRFRP
jgi:DnaJ-class molecular chaperone